MLKTISHEELTDEQRESLPDHLPADTELTVCLGCGSIRDQGPFGFDAWKNHEDECVPYAAGDDEDDEIPDGLDSWQPHELTGWLAAVEDNPTNSAEYVALARQAVGKALGVN
ncbi:MAG TPA: hypothetical protein VN520_14240 [Streptomyces sp.]|uniref:hypothetical protein n=1 Tax=Streptomyces sp. TaxID=1931 RepID=UPI002C38E189|nr:hypothetical protein [Streptomyces sp.]HWU07517.1 hypothetical protein [Streptomyces sp.]